ncbi:fibronectin type III domain-containing protein [Pelagicoccus sp. NFK12]|uniref:Fibronectin type III domain-containing protein n=1 Tax=Pelagicoccus enzymogenes TaxID=2773457 RepID=A0A927IIY3_9BACT|nr:fibronectin type III domain-containing protein [Pelagicoccus enzymogenes]MBD5780975.1 fibronectin type III domain-containing protein [Pelagicoccus enzymogenes]
MKARSFFRSLLLLLCPTFLIAAGPNSQNSQRIADSVYFLQSADDQISRYDLTSQSWLDPIAIGESASCFVVVDDFLFVAYGKILYRYQLDGSDETHVGNFLHPIISLHADGDLLFVNHSSGSYAYFDSYDQNTLGRLDTFTNYQAFAASTVVEPSLNQLYHARSSNSRYTINYDDNGTFVGSLQGNTAYNTTTGDYFLRWPERSRILGQSGWIYDSSSFLPIGQIAAVDSIAFIEGELPMIVSGDELITYSKGLQETGRLTLDAANGNLFLHGETAFIFYPNVLSGTGFTLQRIPFADLAIDDPSEPIDPSKLAFEPDEVFATSNGKLFLSHHDLSTLFSWDIATQSWDSTIELEGLPVAIRYAPDTELIYIAYSNGKIFKIDPTDPTYKESLIVDTESQINSLVAAGSFVFTSISNIEWSGIKIYDLDGNVTGYIQHRYDTFDAVWANGRVVSNRGNSSYLHDFVVQESGNTGTYGSKSFNDISVSGPLFPHPDQQLVLTSSGILYDALEKEAAGVLPESVVGATWIEGQLYTLHNGSIKTWSLPTYAEGSSISFQNRAYAISNSPEGDLVLVTLAGNGKPRIIVLDTSYNIIALESIPDPKLSFGQMNAGALSVEWTASAGAESYLIERSEASDGPWEQIAALDFDAGSFADVDIAVGETYYYRVKAINDSIESNYSNVIAVDTSREPLPIEAGDPSQISRYARSAVLDKNNILYLSIDDRKGIYRYDVEKQTWLETIATLTEPNRLTYSEARHSLFFRGYDGDLMEVNLNGSPLIPVLFVKFDNYNYGDVQLATEDFVLVTYSSQHFIYDPLGNLMSSAYLGEIDYNALVVWNEEQRTYSWSESYRVYEVEVGPGWTLESSYVPIENNDRFVASNDDHTLFLSQSGNIYSRSNYAELYSIEDYLEDGLWLGDQLITLAGSSLQKRDASTFEVTDSLPILEDRRILLSTSDGRIVLVQGDYYGSPEISVLDADFEIAAPDTIAAPPAFLIQDSYSYRTVLKWSDVGGETGYILERRTGSGPWDTIAELEMNTTSYHDEDISSDYSYSYRLRGINGDTPSTYSDTLSLRSAPPTAATDLEATSTGAYTHRLQWEPSENVLFYQIQYALNGDDYWNNYNTDGKLTAPEFTVTIQSNQIYRFRIKSVGSYGQEALSEPIVLFEDLIKPTPPSSLNASPLDYRTVALEWYGSQRATSYQLERKEPDGDNEWSVLATLATSPRYFVDSSAEAETRYQYRIIAINPEGSSVAKLSSIVTTEKRYPPEKPFLSAGLHSDDSVLLNWSNISTDVSYHILRRLAGEEDWTELDIDDPDSQTYIDSELESGQTYVYSATASNPAGDSPYADPVIVKIVPQEAVFQDDFTDGLDPSRYAHVYGSTVASQESGIGTYLALNSSRMSIVTLPLDLSDGGNVSFDLKFDGASVNLAANLLSVELRVGNSNLKIARIIATPQLAGQWVRYSVSIPFGTSDDETSVIFYHSESPVYANRFLFDNIVITQSEPPVPLSPLTVAAKSAPDGGVSVFWTPSKHATAYRIEHSVNGGETWLETGLPVSGVTYYHDPSPYNEDSLYRVSAINSAGASEPTLSNAATSDDELAEAVQLGVEKVLADPDTYQLYSATELEQSRLQGQFDVRQNPSGFGLYQQEFISNLYFKLTSGPIQMKGDLMSFGWILYRSTNLVDWTEHPFSIEFENDEENEAEFIKIRPDTE